MSASNDDAATAEAGAAGSPRSQEMYREKPVSTIVRVLTVMAYLTSVSFAAILLSVYYICIWKSPVLPELDKENRLLARQGDHNEYTPDYPANVLHNLTGRSDIAVNDNSTETTIENLNFTSTETVESTDVLEGMKTYTPIDSSEPENLTETTSLNIATVT